jgi:hypothetical protein
VSSDDYSGEEGDEEAGLSGAGDGAGCFHCVKWGLQYRIKHEQEWMVP